MPPQSLFDDQPHFVWRDDAKFKNLGDLNDLEASVLASFCVGVGRHVVAAVPSDAPNTGATSLPDAANLRKILLQDSAVVDLGTLLILCWGLRLPVIQLQLFPLRNKGLHAVTTRSGGRYAIMIGRVTSYKAQACFWIAHELGHIALGHLGESCALLEIEDPIERIDDVEEQAANKYAVELLTGTPDPQIEVTTRVYSASQLASAVQPAALAHVIDPSVLALCTARLDGRWEQAFGALKILGDQTDVPARLNWVALAQLHLSSLSQDNRDFLRTVMGVS